MSFSGLRVLSLESRRAKEMEALIVRHGGQPFVAPSVKERAIESNEPVFAWAERLLAGEFDMTVLMTGTGLTYLRAAVVTRHPLERFVEGLRRTTLVSRGPKPVVVLHELGLKPQVIVPEPNTWREIVSLIAPRSERSLTVQEYGKPNAEFIAALEANGSRVTPLAIYRWELPDDLAPLREAVRQIAQRDCDVIVFTTSVQLVHLLQVAGEMGRGQEVMESLSRDLVIASVGPIMDAALAERGLKPDIVPAHPKMGILMRAAAEQSVAAVTRKRAHLSRP
jgi:uroporphyrinogen-III synthase